MPEQNPAYEEAVSRYYAKRQADTLVRTHTKLLIALPKHKKKFYLRLLAQCQAKAYSATSAFKKSLEKLSLPEQLALMRQVYI